MYEPSFMNTGSGIKKLMEAAGFTDTQAALWSHKPTFFSKLRK
jgi:hypothetical protein